MRVVHTGKCSPQGVVVVVVSTPQLNARGSQGTCGWYTLANAAHRVRLLLLSVALRPQKRVPRTATSTFTQLLSSAGCRPDCVCLSVHGVRAGLRVFVSPRGAGRIACICQSTGCGPDCVDGRVFMTSLHGQPHTVFRWRLYFPVWRVDARSSASSIMSMS